MCWWSLSQIPQRQLGMSCSRLQLSCPRCDEKLPQRATAWARKERRKTLYSKFFIGLNSKQAVPLSSVLQSLKAFPPSKKTRKTSKFGIMLWTITKDCWSLCLKQKQVGNSTLVSINKRMPEWADQTQGSLDIFGADGAANVLTEESPMPKAILLWFLSHYSAWGRGMDKNS